MAGLQLNDANGLDTEDKHTPYQAHQGSPLEDHWQVDIWKRHGAHCKG